MTLKTDIDRIAVDSGLLHSVVHGGSTATVTTEGGAVKTVAKTLADVTAAILDPATGTLAAATASATASAGTATTQAGIATTQAGIATTQAGNASASAVAAAASAAGITSDLEVLSAGVALALDLTGPIATMATDATTAVAAANAATLVAGGANVVTQQLLASGLQAVLDFLSVVAGQVTGGKVQLAAGSATEPALWAVGDSNTGAFFPAADVVALVTAGLERLRVDANGRLGIGTTAPSGLLDVADSKLRVRTAATPASAAAAGNAGEICWDASYVYVCTATNTWKRAALASW